MMAETIDVLIKNGNVIDPDDRKISKRSIAIRNGKIVDYDPDVIYNVKDEIDAEGYYVSPGWVDSHVHVFKE